ncbi:MAG: TIR domain-containing protein [Phycisphaerae bacterium]|nr:TIR domain-containing protein [Phycisphaerae bacterium]
MENEAREKRPFDVFLSHNRKDKPAVRELAAALRKRGIKVWLDEDELIAGDNWQHGLENGITDSDTFAVCIGPAGIGPWEDQEMQAALVLAVELKRRVIPVVLPAAPEKPQMSLFLRTRTWVDLRPSLTEEGLAKLERGITGRRPGSDTTNDIPRSGPPCDRPPRAQAGKLFGRDAQLDDLIGRLRRRESTCVWGPAGFGKTALAAEAIHRLLAEVGDDLARSPFPGGIVLLDLYRLSDHGGRPWDQLAEQAWHTLADKLEPAQRADQPARDRARKACAGRQALVVVEGAEEAGDCENLTDLLSVLDDVARRLVLTRSKGQCALHDFIHVDVELEHSEALALLRKLAQGRASEDVLTGVLHALGGHPLALTWAGCQLALAEEPPTLFLKELQAEKLPRLHDPQYEKHTLRWLYDRSVRRLPEDARRVLAAAGLLAPAPFDAGVAVAALWETDTPQTPETDARAHEALRQLVRQGLLRLVPDDERWEFTHPLAARFATDEGAFSICLLQALSRWIPHAFQNAVMHLRRTQDFSCVQAVSLHASALLAHDKTRDAAGWLADWLLYDGQDLLFALGRVGHARDSLSSVETWMLRQAEEKRATSQWRREFSCVLNRQGDILLAQGDLAGARASYERSHNIREELVRGDPTSAQWQRDLCVSLERLGDVQLAQGDLAGARANYEQSRKVHEKLAQGDPTNAQWQRDLSVSLEKLGDIQMAQGDLAGARASYEQSFAIREKLARGEPANVVRLRDLTISVERLGDVRSAQGDLAGARVKYELSRKVHEKLAQGDPTNAQWQRVLSVSLEKLGDVQLAQGDLVGAWASYEQSHKIRKKLAQGDPTNAQWQRDLGVSLEKFGNVQWMREDLAGARGSYERSRRIHEKLAASDPTNAEWQRDLGMSLIKLGDVQLAQRDLAGAWASYGQSHKIREKLARGDPTNASRQYDLSVSNERLGTVLQEQGDLEGALDAFRKKFGIINKLTQGDPTNAEWQRDLVVSRGKLGDLAAKAGNPVAARQEFTAALAIAERLTKLDPTNATWRNDVAWLRDRLGQLPPV